MSSSAVLPIAAPDQPIPSGLFGDVRYFINDDVDEATREQVSASSRQHDDGTYWTVLTVYSFQFTNSDPQTAHYGWSSTAQRIFDSQQQSVRHQSAPLSTRVGDPCHCPHRELSRISALRRTHSYRLDACFQSPSRRYCKYATIANIVACLRDFPRIIRRSKLTSPSGTFRYWLSYRSPAGMGTSKCPSQDATQGGSILLSYCHDLLGSLRISFQIRALQGRSRAHQQHRLGLRWPLERRSLLRRQRLSHHLHVQHQTRQDHQHSRQADHLCRASVD